MNLVPSNTLRRIHRFLIRKYWARKLNQKIDSQTHISFRQRFISSTVEIGKCTFIAPGCTVYPNVKIGNFCLLAPNVSIIGGDHKYDLVGVPIIYAGREIIKSTLIEDDVWIGQNSIIMCGMKIGKGAVVATGSVVTKDVPPNAIVGGNPARPIRARFTQDDYELHVKKLRAYESQTSFLGGLK